MQKTNVTLIMALFALIFVVSCTQKHDGFTIQGNVEGFEDSTKVYLRDSDKQANVDSSLILNGKFEFSGKVNEPKNYTIMTKYVPGQPERPDMTMLWVDNAEIKLTGNKENFKFMQIQGSKPQEKADILNAAKEPFARKLDSLNDEYYAHMMSGNRDIDTIKAYRKQISELNSKTDEIRMDFIRENINSYHALYLLGFEKNRMPEDTLQMLYDKINEDFKQTSYAKVLHTFLNTEPAKVGEPFKDFTAQTMDGKSFNLSDVKDKYILLEFGSANCGPCRIFNRTLAKEYDNFKEQMEIVSFSLDVNKEEMIKEADKDGVSWTLVSDFKGNDGKTPIQYRVYVIPTFYIISPEGIIVERIVGFTPTYLDKFKKIVEDHKKEA